MKDFAVETRYALMTGSITLSAEDFLHLVSERNAAVTDLEIVADCCTCKYYGDMHADCIGYEWRGVAHNESPDC